jgi:UDP-GlcNAc:undecaprenyl-phosphate/decaprenyl-phosphate GlcNAc-1-phosphate transferase
VSHVLPFTAAVVLALALTPAVRTLARRWDLVDAPGQRKIHTVSVPRIGGVAVTLGMLLALAASASMGHVSPADVHAWSPVLLGGALIFGVGL